MSILLTDDELRDLAWHIAANRVPNQMGYMRDTALTQLKNVAEWGEEDCEEHVSLAGRKRWQCPECWQALKKEVGL